MAVFWLFARRMLRYRGTLAAALLMAVISALGLGAGLLGISPVLENILPPTALVGPDGQVISESGGRDLPQLVSALNERRLGGVIPGAWIDALPDGRFNAVVWIIIVLGVLTVVGATANFLHAYLSLTVVNRVVTNIRREVFHRVLRLPLKDVVASGPTEAISRIVGDTTALAAGFNALISKAVAQASKGMAALVAALIIEWRLTLVALLVAPVLGAVIRKLGKRIRRASRSALQSQAGLYSAAVEAMQGLRVVKVHTNERYEAGRFHRINKDVMREMNRVRTARALSGPLVEVLAILVLGVLSLAAAKAIIDTQLDPRHFLLALASLGVAGASLKPLTGIMNDIQSSAAAAERLQDLLKAAPEPGHDARLPKLARHSKSIEFRGVTFTYPGAERPALRGIDLTIRHGERVAVVGPNGSGKTTLLALVPRLFDPNPGGGTVLIDGRDIREFGVRSVRRQIGVVTQETVIFRTTIRANIAYGSDDPLSDQRVLEAARNARAHDFIAALPSGYETVVGEQGLTLSGGQRQRIAIARAILREPAILILDEATSMIDADSEAKIAEAIAEFTQGRTCLIVAHRLSTVMHADRIVVLDEGCVVDQGRHAELLQRCETYRLIAQTQLVQGNYPMPAARARRAVE